MELKTLNLDNIDINETNSVLKELKELDLERVSFSRIEKLLLKIYKHIGTEYRLSRGRFIQRTLLLDNEELDFYPRTVGRVSYNPKGSELGRANCEGEAMFYGSLNTELVPGYFCSGMEVLPQQKDGFYQHRFVVGNWVLSQDTTFVAIGGTDELVQQIEYVQSQRAFLDSKLKDYPSAIIPLNSINQFITHEFNKTVTHSWEYKISATYSKLIGTNGGNGIMYPSVKAAGGGINLALFPDKVSNGMIQFDRLLYGTYYNRHGDFCNEIVGRAYTLNDSDLIWKDEYKRLPRVIKDYYTGVSNYNPLDSIKKTNLDIRQSIKPRFLN